MSMADCERPDSLEGWVAIKNNIFDETELFKLGFIVQWNVTECKFALTCHNRTLQRQRRKAELSPGDGEVSWAGLFSVNDLKHIHQQFSCVADVLGACFPDLSAFDQGSIWDVLIPNRRSNPGDDVELPDFDTPCRKLEKYLSTAVDLCGRTIVLDTLFTQDDRDVEEYFENMQEFKKKSMQEEMSRSKDHLRQLLHTHSHTEAMVALVSIYEEEDEAYQELVTVATSFFHYLLQPFRDMRELACLYKLEILKSLEVEDLGPKRIAALEKEVEEWRIKGEDAVGSIQDITVTYFAQTSKALAGMLKQMEEDKCRFGPAAWASAAPRLEKLRFLLAKETLQHMRATEMCLNRKKGNIREQLQNLPGHVQNQTAEGQHNHSVDQMEMQYYEIQLEIYNTKFEILKNEEQLLVAQIDSLRRQIKELKEEVLYYDVCEDPEELQSMVHTGLQQTNSPAVTQLRRRLQVLETKRGNICARRAYLRNKKDQCMEAHEQKHLSAEQSSIVFSQHHQIHLKREKKREEEQRRKEWVDQEREKTLSRLRSFREKRQGKYILKTPQSRSPPEASTPSQPLSIISLGPSPSSGKPPASVRPAPRSNKTGRKPQPREIPVQIYCTAPPQTNTTATSCPAVPPPPPPPPPPPLPPPPPPLPPAVPPPPVCDDTPSPLSEKQAPPFPAKTTLKQNIGTMDEVLASLQRGQSQLRKVSAAPPAENPRDSLMSAIRLGVTLKKVVATRAELQSSSDNELERSIKAAIMRMKNVSADSDEEDEGDETRSIEWDS